MSHSTVPRTASQIKVWIVEDDRRYRETRVYLLNHAPGLQCTRAFPSYEEVPVYLQRDGACAPDVVLMDIKLPGRSGIEGTRDLKSRLPDVAILMLTVEDSPACIFEALQAGASGYLLKETPFDDTIEAIHQAVRGGTLMPAPVARIVLDFFGQVPSRPDYGLTSRETEILRLMSQGWGQKQIASTLSISPHTVDSHNRNIYRKLHVRSGLEAVVKAVRERLI